jgi:hypothetical protein
MPAYGLSAALAGDDDEYAQTESLIDQYLRQSGGDPWAAQVDVERERLGDPMSPALRNAGHALLTQAFPPAAALVPAYSGAKWAAQNVPGGRYLDYLMPRGMELSTASRPSWSEIYWGMSPLWRSLRRR